MTYEEFQKELLNKLQGGLAGIAMLRLTQRKKENDQLKSGIEFRAPVSNAAPVIYLEEYYELYQKGGGIEDIAEDIRELYFSLPVLHFEEQTFVDFRQARSRSTMKLINAKKNHAFLETVPHIPFLDLAIIYHYVFKTDKDGILSKVVDYELLNIWGTDVMTLHQHALANYNRLLPVKFIKAINCAKEQQMPKEENLALADELLPVTINDSLQNYMYILSNKYNRWGAALMTCKSLMDEIAELFGDDFYILPSSLHEIILIPASKAKPKEELDLMIQDVNENVLYPQDYLSDHAYFYSKSGKDSIPSFGQDIHINSFPVSE